MLLNYFNGVIGLKGSTNPLNFNHMNNGILAFNCNFMVTNSKFHHISSYDVPITLQSFNGTGILAIGNGINSSVLSQEGLGKYNNIATFDHCKFGVIGVRSTLDISENKMTDIEETGIKNYFSMLRSINIYNNNIYASFNGVHSSFGSLSTKIEIHHNDVTINNLPGNFVAGAIVIDENLANNTANLKIYENDLTVTSWGNGITLNATKLSSVYSNTIHLNDEVNPVSGIRSNFCKDINVHHNIITGTGDGFESSPNWQTGISTNWTTFSHIDNNTTNESNRGLYFSGQCDGTFMECNDIGNHTVGTMMETGGRFNHQHIDAKNE